MTVWFTADQHFGHARLLELSAARGAAFASVTEMNARLITSWNTVDAPDDTVYVLGDFDMHGKDATLAFVGPLAGTKILISGNHVLGRRTRRMEEPRPVSGRWVRRGHGLRGDDAPADSAAGNAGAALALPLLRRLRRRGPVRAVPAAPCPTLPTRPSSGHSTATTSTATCATSTWPHSTTRGERYVH